MPLQNFTDLIDLFLLKINGRTRPAGGKLRILIYNWRDIQHIWSGGAEVYVHELAKRWVVQGHQVTLFCGNDGQSSRTQTIDGVHIIRRGGFYTVYLWAFLYYIFRFRARFDVVIDNENGIPFFTPLYSRQPVIGLIHHVHKDIFLKNLSLPRILLPVAFIAQQLESKFMPLVYRNSQIVAVSRSTRKDLLKLGFGKKLSIQIINPGVDLEQLKPGRKTARPSILYLGRLKPYKSIDVIIRAMPGVIRRYPRAILNIAGFGESRGPLEALTKKLNLGKHVKFLGKVSEQQKARLLRAAWVFAYPSSMEGWGIAALEASASGTAVVASNVPGLRDSVRNPSTGYLVPYGNSRRFARQINRLISQPNLRAEFGKNGVQWAQKFDWQLKADQFLHILEKEVDQKSAVALKPSFAFAKE